MITTERTRVRMLRSVAGGAMPDYGIHADFAFTPGETTELHPALAEAWTDCGHAEAVPDEKKPKKKAR